MVAKSSEAVAVGGSLGPLLACDPALRGLSASSVGHPQFTVRSGNLAANVWEKVVTVTWVLTFLISLLPEGFD